MKIKTLLTAYVLSNLVGIQVAFSNSEQPVSEKSLTPVVKNTDLSSLVKKDANTYYFNPTLDEQPPFEDNLLKYPIKSSADLGSVINEEVARKARLVAEYIITHKDHDGLIEYEPNCNVRDDYQGVCVNMNINNWNYSILVTIHNKETDDKETDYNLRDALIIWTRLEGTQGPEQLFRVGDDGLDGNCDLGISPKALSPMGTHKIFYLSQDPNLTSVGSEHRDWFQKKYEGILDILLEFYKSE